MTLNQLEKDLLSTLEDEWKDHEKEDEDTQREWISEHVDGFIPIYNSDLLEVALSCLWLATEEPELLGFDGKPTAVSCITGNLYGHLQEKGQEWLDAKKESL